MTVFWGDLHAHCAVSYGEGTVEESLLRARQQLDFCSITGHAFWPDMPTDRDRYGPIIDYHRTGFARLAGNWDELLRELAQANQAGTFVTFPSYEWHSLAYGDHNVYGCSDHLPLQDAPDVAALRGVARDNSAIAVPHHIGYQAGYRGVNWEAFDARQSPIVEIFSLHGCSLSDRSPHPMLHDMGPRDFRSTAVAGWKAGHHFGIIASTDHHGGYPGSYGDGRAAVIVEQLSRESLWNAIQQRRTYAVTGDKILAEMTLNDAPIGSIVSSSKSEPRRIRLAVRGRHALQAIELLKNESILRRFFPETLRENTSSVGRYRLRVNWGWGRKDEPVEWSLALRLSEGAITHVESCFSGQSIVAPQGVAGHERGSDRSVLPHEILENTPRQVRWRSCTTGNLSTRHPTHQGLILDIEAPPTARVIVESEHGRYEHALPELLDGSHCHYQRGWLSEALCIGPLIPEAECCLEAEWTDETRSAPGDYYRLQVAQVNQQYAWLTPVWVE